ncbi:MAG: alkaline phosphatase family protein [Armatimonadetes bacterium]|nr:alkaline phosphatase family protein [Armatimonadota bacterium]
MLPWFAPLRRTVGRWFLLALLGVLAPAAFGAPAERVVIVSLDGARPDALQRARVPVMRQLWESGAHSWTAHAVLPSVTLPNHASMVTGLLPAGHGITWNDYKPRRGTLSVPTIFSVAREAGLRVALFAGKTKFRHLVAKDTLTRFSIPGVSAREIGAAATAYYRRYRPQLLFVHFPDPDSAGHFWGWMSAAQMRALADCDAAVGRLTAAIRSAGDWERTLFLITSDHGGHGRGHGSARAVDQLIPWIAAGGAARPHTDLRVEISTCDTAATVLFALGLPLPSGCQGRPVVEALASPGDVHGVPKRSPALSQPESPGPIGGTMGSPSTRAGVVPKAFGTGPDGSGTGDCSGAAPGAARSKERVAQETGFVPRINR